MRAITLNNVSKKFGSKVLFHEFNLTIEQGDFIAITGGSGSGKTTLMNIIGLIEPCDQGSVDVLTYQDVKPNSRQSGLVIRNEIGYLFQNYALIDDESVEANLNVGLKYQKISKEDKAKRMAHTLQRVGLKGYKKRKVFELSGGEQQRIAVARVMLKPSNIILADEPTGSLDEANREIIIELLKEMNAEGKTIIIVTHDPYIAGRCNRVINLDEKR